MFTLPSLPDHTPGAADHSTASGNLSMSSGLEPLSTNPAWSKRAGPHRYGRLDGHRDQSRFDILGGSKSRPYIQTFVFFRREGFSKY